MGFLVQSLDKKYTFRALIKNTLLEEKKED